MRRKVLAGIVVLVLGSALAVSAQGPGMMGQQGTMGPGMMGQTGPGAPGTYGRNLYYYNCAPCHGVLGNGQGPEGRAMRAFRVDFTNPSFWQSDAPQRIRNAVENGYGPMPPIGLYPAQISAIIEYMSRTFGPGEKK
jgi:mono/diheme cytochrome c family protein